MPRVLPWKKSAVVVSSSSTSRPSNIAPVKRARDDLPSLEEAEVALHSIRDGGVAQDRWDHALDDTPSSPVELAPNHELLVTPEIEYMVQGFDHDDRHMMVEDELCSTAQEYTRHLHQEEYVRLKKLAKTRMREAIDERAVDRSIEPNLQTQLKGQRREKDKIMRQKIKDMPRTGQSQERTRLTSLLEKEEACSVDLTGVIRKNKVMTKAAALGSSVARQIVEPTQLTTRGPSTMSSFNDNDRLSVPVRPNNNINLIQSTLDDKAGGRPWSTPVSNTVDGTRSTSTASDFLEKRRAALAKRNNDA